MSDRFSAADLDAMVDELLAERPDLIEAVNTTSLTPETIRERVRERFKTEPLVPSTTDLDRLRRLEKEQRGFGEEWGERDSEASFADVIGGAIGIALVAYCVGFAVLREAVNRLPGALSIAIAVAPVVAFAGYVGRRYAQYRADAPTVEERRGRMRQVEQELERASADIRKTVKESSVLPVIGDIVSLATDVRYDESLTGTVFLGLSQVLDTHLELSTPWHDQVVDVIAHMPGGSIGIAGQRGVGKTTLLRSICNPSRTFPGKSKPTIAILVSAPVDYNARDFFLYLFSALCREVETWFRDEAMRLSENDSSPPSRARAWLGKARIRRRSRQRTHAHLDPFLPRLGLFASLVFATIGLAGVSLSVFAIRSDSTWERYGEPFLEVGLTPVVGFWTGLCLFAFGIFGWWNERRGERTAGSGPLDPRSDPRDMIDLASASDDILPLTGRLLQEMKFQQSYSVGWSGGLRFPIGVETGGSSSFALAKKQMSLPELVHAYRLFVGNLAKQYLVAIGIDELDKVESPESARNLLNDLKGLFDTANTFYLISVSENALASFDNRGISVRDVMDSSFDTVLQVGPLSLADSRKLLNRRAISLPLPFVALCHGLSGGLPRDLIRVCRSMAELDSDGTRDLREVAGQILQEAVMAQSRAFAFTMESAGFAKNVPNVVIAVDKLRTTTVTSASLLTASRAIADEAATIRATTIASDKESEDLAFRCERFAVFLFHAATLSEFYETAHSEGDWRRVEASGAFDLLASAKHVLAGIPSAAADRVERARSAIGLPGFLETEGFSIGPRRPRVT